MAEEDEDSPTWRAVKRAAACGVLGGTVGGALASVRDANAMFYVSAMSTNYMAMGLTYFGVLELAKVGFPRYKDTWQIHAGVGTAVGSFFGLTFSAPRRLPQFAGFFALAGVGGFFAHEKLVEWQASLAKQRIESKRVRHNTSVESNHE